MIFGKQRGRGASGLGTPILTPKLFTQKVSTREHSVELMTEQLHLFEQISFPFQTNTLRCPVPHPSIVCPKPVCMLDGFFRYLFPCPFSILSPLRPSPSPKPPTIPFAATADAGDQGFDGNTSTFNTFC